MSFSNTNEEIDPYIPNTERNGDVNMPTVKLAGDINYKGKEVSLSVTGQYPVIDVVENNFNLLYTASPNKNVTSPSAHIFPISNMDTYVDISCPNSLLYSNSPCTHNANVTHNILPHHVHNRSHSDAFVALKEIRCKNFNRVIFGHLNINSIRYKMEMLTQYRENRYFAYI